MCAIQSNHDSGAERADRHAGAENTRNSIRSTILRIEPVDHWHEAWDSVIEAVRKQGRFSRLRIDCDGWLSARQVLMVAFVGEEPAAHLCFSVSPGKSGCIEAKVETHGIVPRHAGRGIESQLHQAAVERARSLRCEQLRGFRLGSEWC